MAQVKFIFGTSGSDRLVGRLGDKPDHIYAGMSIDFEANDGNDTLIGRGGDDALTAWGGSDRLYGGTGEDMADGGVGNDRLFGGGGADWLQGGKGNDRLNGGAGHDNLDGGAGADVFIFSKAFHSKNELLTDFKPGVDRIDISALTQNAKWLGKKEFTNTPGEVRFGLVAGTVECDVNGDGQRDWSVQVLYFEGLSRGDLIL
jgi:Ca2+-binding RTX toxin-like protein